MKLFLSGFLFCFLINVNGQITTAQWRLRANGDSLEYKKNDGTWTAVSGSGGSQVPQAFVDSMRAMLRNTLDGDTSIVFGGGVIRNFCGSGTTIDWDFINNTDHTLLNFIDSADAIGTNDVRVFFRAGTKCISFWAVPDETMSAAGYQMGASFSLDHADIRISKIRNQSCAIWFNGVGSGINIYANTTGGVVYDTTTGKFTATIISQANMLEAKFSTSITSANPLYYPVIDGDATYNSTNQVIFYLYNRSDNTVVTGTHSFRPLVHLSAPTYWTPEVVNNTVGSGMGCGGSANIWIGYLMKK